MCHRCAYYHKPISVSTLVCKHSCSNTQCLSCCIGRQVGNAAKLSHGFHYFHPCSSCLKMCLLLAGVSRDGPFEHTSWSVKQQLYNKQSWRPLTQHEVSHVMSPWTDRTDRPRGPHRRITFDHKNKLKNQSEVGHAIR